MRKTMFRWLIALAIVVPCMVVAASAATLPQSGTISGNYTLVDNVVLSDRLTVSGDAVVDLAGYDITAPDYRIAFYVPNDARLTINDSEGDGTICKSFKENVIEVCYSGELVLNGGTLTGSISADGCFGDVASVTMSGGVVEGGIGGRDSSLSIHGGVVLGGVSSGPFSWIRLSGGEIYGGVGVGPGCELKVSGEVEIDDISFNDSWAGTISGGKVGNVYLSATLLVISGNAQIYGLQGDGEVTITQLTNGAYVKSDIMPTATDDTVAGLKEYVYFGDVEDGVPVSYGSCGSGVEWVLYRDGELIIFGDGTIDSEAFYCCPSLTGVTILDGVAGIGVDAFFGCDGLTSITIPDSVTSIGDSAFAHCDSLTNVTIPNCVTTIGHFAFGECGCMTRIEVADSNEIYCDVDGVLFSKDKMILYQCPGGKIGTYAIPTGTISILDSAFEGCEKLGSVAIPDSVTTIGSYAFSNCYGLTEVVIPDGVTDVGEFVFEECASLTDVTIGRGITNIGSGMFNNCIGLTDVTIPASASIIGANAFEGCAALTNVTIPDSVATIGARAFMGCEKLAQVTIPSSVISIGELAFASCFALTRVDFLGCVPTKVGNKIFGYTSKVTVYYHEGMEGWPTTNTWEGYPLVMQPHVAVAIPAVAATCSETGLTKGSCCDICESVLIKQGVVPALGHNLVHCEGKEPTANSAGWVEYDACTRCDYSTYKELQAGYQPTRFKFSLEAIKTIKQNGKTVEICRWVWTPIYN